MTRRLRLPEEISACLFDLDGVLTRTAELHADAWKQTFDVFLRDWTARGRGASVPFDAVVDYNTDVDWRPRADGVRPFLSSRGIELPAGSSSDPASADTVHGPGRRKNELLRELMARHGVSAYDGSVDFLGAVRELAGLGGLSSHRARTRAPCCARPGWRARATSWSTGSSHGSSPSPANPRQTCSWRQRDAWARYQGRQPCSRTRSPVSPPDEQVIFGLVIGVDRRGRAAELRASGADAIVADLAELIETP